MKKVSIYCIGILCHYCVYAQYEASMVGIGYSFMNTTMEGVFFNGNFQNTSNQMQVNYETLKFKGGNVPIEAEIFTKNVLVNINMYVPIGGKSSSHSTVLTKASDSPILKTGLGFGGWIAKTIGVFGGLHYHGTIFNATLSKNVPSNVKIPSMIKKPISDKVVLPTYYGIDEMIINERGPDFHILLGKKFLIKNSIFYDFVRAGRKSMSLENYVLKGTALTYELSVYVPLNKDKDFGVYTKFGYKNREIEGINLYDPLIGFFPSTNLKQMYFTLGILLPAEFLASTTVTRESIRVIQ